MSMTMKYSCIQIFTFAIITAGASLVLGFGIAALLVGLIMSILVVAVVAWYDVGVKCSRLQDSNLFTVLSDAQLRECYEAYLALEAGQESHSLLFYQLITRYEDASNNGYDHAVDDLLSAITSRWTHFDTDSTRRVS